ncbi:glycoside hydrolase family 2 TIM barrel-domain containing protein [Abditibacterium utsteinense]|nr:glycoside hydrolase family 2 TIM barrel-domain containing protein [Abditibacterium utsteinense]
MVKNLSLWAALLCGATLSCVAAPVSAQSNAPLPPEIENEQILSIGKEPWHATLMPYGTQSEALKANRRASSFARSLNGAWKFNYVPRPEERPVDFYKTNFDDSAWKTIPVPSNWQLHGYGTPYYRNIGYTFQNDWPHVMSEPPKDYTAYTERNPVGSYRRNFDVPANWNGRRVFLNFDGVDSAFFVWVNGEKVGYNTGSRNATEFDITPFLKSGQSNSLAVEVYRYSSGSYLEDMDMWRLSGIFRNVTLWSAPVVHVRDFRVTTDLDAKYRNATLRVEAKVHNYGAKSVAARNFAVTLFNAAGKPVGAPVKVAVPALAAGTEKSVSVPMLVANPAKWTAETPNLYTAVLSLSSGNNAPELLSHRVGFREIEVKGRLFCVNGVPVKLKGADRHESNVNTGHYVTEANMIEDIKLLKQANCNHVRTSHYSNDPRWYELCDQYGIYLVAEANLECHGNQSLSSEPRMEKMFVDRNVANVENFKNSPSILMWSLGNESGNGPNLRAAERMVRSLDSTRVTHYEAFGGGLSNPAGIVSQMYTDQASLDRVGQDAGQTKPFYLCEYAHAMFNSMGGLGEYNDIFDKYPGLMGGAIWEWEDQGIWNRRDPKRQFIAYGGGFGEYPNDHYFIHKGVVFSDRSPKPHYPEVKRVYQWINFSPVDLSQGRIKIKNKYAFINLNGFKGSWSLQEDGKRVQSGALPQLNLSPGKEVTLGVPLKSFQPKAGAHYYLNVSMALAKDTLWAKSGYEVARAQLEMPAAAPSPALNPATMQPLQLVSNGGNVTVTGSGFDLAFNAATGQMTRLARGGVNVILPGGGPELHLWRAQHRKDDEYAAIGWDRMGLKELTSRLVNFEAKQVSPSQVSVNETIQYTGKNSFSVTHATNYSIFGDGSVTVDNAVMPQGPDIVLARVGVRMLLDKRLANVDYLARGPMENYSDRKRGSDIGHYSSTVAQQMTPYAKPMDNGNHEDTRFIALRGQGMPTLLTQSQGAPLQFSALPYRDEEMEPVEYRVDLPPSNATVLCLASKTLGVGSASCGPRPLPQYLLHSNAQAFSYGLRLLPTSVADVTAIARTVASPNRAWPALATRDQQGLVALDANGDALSYSLNGATWQPYSAPFQFAQGGQLRVRSTAKTGQIIEDIIPFDAFADRRLWKVTASDFQNGEGNAEHIIDGDSGTFWHSEYSPNKPTLPHFLVVDMAAPLDIKAVRVTPRADGSNGRARDYELYLSNDADNFGAPVLKGNLPDEGSIQILTLPTPQKARFMKFVIKSEYSRQDLGSLAEIDIVPADVSAN